MARAGGRVVLATAVYVGLFALADAIGTDGAFVGWLVATALFGALVDRWWAILVPVAVLGAWFGVDELTTTCDSCEDEWPQLVLFVIILPAAVATALGVGARRLERFFHWLD